MSSYVKILGMIHYQNHLEGIKSDQIEGFCVGWRTPISPDKYLQVLQRSTHVILALDSDTNKVVGSINALSDGIHAAFIPLLEVVPHYQGQGIGTELVKRMLKTLEHLSCVDLTCDPSVQDFYKRLGMQPSNGMIVRNY